MKSVSLILRVLAILGACACVGLWFNVKDKIKTATADMKDVPGVVLNEKSAKIPGILSEKKKTEEDLVAANATIVARDARIKELTSNLESEQAKNVSLNKDLSQTKTDLRKKGIEVEDLQKIAQVDKKKIQDLTKEIIDLKASIQDTAQIDALNQRYVALQTKYDAMQKEYVVAKEKADKFDMSTIVEVSRIEDKEAGTVTVTKEIRTPLLGEKPAIVREVSEAHDLMTINRGKSDEINVDQKIDVRSADGEFIAQILIVEVGPDYAIASINPKIAKPETLEKGDEIILVPTVELKQSDAQIESSSAAPAEAEAPAAAPEAPVAPEAAAE